MLPGRVRAVFLDRDGVLNRNIFYTDTRAWESPRSAAEVDLISGVAAALRALRAAGYMLIVVSNQPNAAKGKCSRTTLDQVQARVIDLLAAEEVYLDYSFLCLHHPDHTGPCACRKPSPYFLQVAAGKYGIDLGQSWMIGDRATDITCGRAAGTRTVWIDASEGNPNPSADNRPELITSSLAGAIEFVLALTSAGDGLLAPG